MPNQVLFTLMAWVLPGILVPGFAWLGVLFVGERRDRQRRREAFARAAADLGMTLTATERAPVDSVLADLPLFRRGDGRFLLNVLRGEDAGTRLLVGDYGYYLGHGRTRHLCRQTFAACVLSQPVFPTLELAPRRLLSWLGDALDARRIAFPDHPLFAAQYVVSGTDEAAVRTLLTPAALSQLQARPGWRVEIRGRVVVAYHVDLRCRADAILRFLAEAQALFAAFGVAPLRRRAA